eukprot:TRINITY_DN21675_c0_g1_i1.p1 TRINITY_DN21675_c0_g1~~TRINITY_DN21675_c0_g1_i1.p1  ORF type:complete len:944 (-),score=170.46 TRINITY_DN21675_c0_g1_i1:371-3202(-)
MLGLSLALFLAACCGTSESIGLSSAPLSTDAESTGSDKASAEESLMRREPRHGHRLAFIVDAHGDASPAGPQQQDDSWKQQQPRGPKVQTLQPVQQQHQQERQQPQPQQQQHQQQQHHHQQQHQHKEQKQQVLHAPKQQEAQQKEHHASKGGSGDVDQQLPLQHQHVQQQHQYQKQKRQPTNRAHGSSDVNSQPLNRGHEAVSTHLGNSTNTNTTQTQGSPLLLFSDLGFLGKALVAIVIIEVIAALLFELLFKGWSASQNDTGAQPGDAVSNPHRRLKPGSMFTGMWTLARPYFVSSKGATGRWCASCIFGFGLMSLFIAWVHNIWHKEWWDLFSKADAKRFPYLLGFFVLLAICVMLNSTYQQYLRSWLYIDMREYMTLSLTQRWLRCHTHYIIQLQSDPSNSENANAEVKTVDNPDQRIQEDVGLFVDSAVDIVPGFLSSCGMLLVFVPVVAYHEPAKAFGVIHCPGWLLYMAIIYSALGVVCTHILGWRLAGTNFDRQRREADFRQLAQHVKEHGESVALYSSERVEEERLRKQFDLIKDVQWEQMGLQKRLGFFTSAFGFIQFLVPFFMLAPSYFNHEVSLGDLFQLTSAIGNVAGSLDWFVNAYSELAQWRAIADRLLSFEAKIAEVEAMQAKAPSQPGFPEPKFRNTDPTRKQPLVFKMDANDGEDDFENGAGENGRSGADNAAFSACIGEVRLPNGEAVWRNVEICLRPGQRLLISGPEGVGKSILFKALAGLWPYVSESHIQSSEEALFVPQRPALPKNCTLAEALAYPDPRSGYTNVELLSALQQVNLEELLVQQRTRGPLKNESVDGEVGSTGTTALWNKEQALEYVDNWGTLLSPGQQQRLALGHVLLKRPKLLFLDEAISNMGKVAAKELYESVLKLLPEDAVVVSVSHDVSLMESLHDLHLTVVGTGETKELKLAAEVLTGDSGSSSAY